MLYVVEVLVPTRGALVPQQIGQTDHGQPQPPPIGKIEALVHAARLRLLERDAIYGADQVDPMRRSAELDDHLRLE